MAVDDLRTVFDDVYGNPRKPRSESRDMSRQSSLPQAARWLRAAREVVVFTGAGVSAESGIPTFRDDEGFWQYFSVEEFATWKGLIETTLHLARHLTESLYAVIQPIAVARPNTGYQSLARHRRTVPFEARSAGSIEPGAALLHETTHQYRRQ